MGKYFGGAFPILDLMQLTDRELFFWYNIYELQVTEEEIANEHLYREDGKKGRLPSTDVMRKLVEERIEKRKEEIKRRSKIGS